MSKRKAKSADRALRRYLASVRGRPALEDSERRSWPVVKAYVPVEDCFRATGCGTAGIVRRAPDGSFASAFFSIHLMRGGIALAFGKEGTEQDTMTTLEGLSGSVPPFELGPADIAGRYVCGAYAWSRDLGRRWTGSIERRYLDLVPLPEGTEESWLQGFTGPRGLVPAKLDGIVRRNISEMPEPPDGREVAVFTTVTFAVDDAEGVVKALRQWAPEFVESGSEGDTTRFGWTREYPKGHWSPLSRLGGRQSIGSVEVLASGSLSAHAQTLSMAAGLIERLEHGLGGHIRMVKTDWRDGADLLGW